MGDRLRERAAGHGVRGYAQHGAHGRVREEHEAVLADHDHRVGGAGQHRGQRAPLVGQGLIGATGLEPAREAGRHERADLEIVEGIGRGSTGEEQRAQDLGAAAHRHGERDPEPRPDQHPVEIGCGVRDRLELRHQVGASGADGPPREPLVLAEDPARHRLAREAGERVHQVAPLLGVLQADREVVVRDHGLRLLRERLEEVGGDGRARQSDEHLADAPQPTGEIRGRLRRLRRHAGPSGPP